MLTFRLLRALTRLLTVGGLLIMEYIEGMTLDVAAMQRRSHNYLRGVMQCIVSSLALARGAL